MILINWGGSVRSSAFNTLLIIVPSFPMWLLEGLLDLVNIVVLFSFSLLYFASMGIGPYVKGILLLWALGCVKGTCISFRVPFVHSSIIFVVAIMCSLVL